MIPHGGTVDHGFGFASKPCQYISQAGLPAQGSSYSPHLPIRAIARTVAICGFRPLSRLRASAGFSPDFPFTLIKDEDLREKTYARWLCGIVADVSSSLDLHTNCFPPASVAQCTSGLRDSG